uniref:Uncharacterized protein n=1 Tax=Oryza punctata TaxID=4537 RepID=A0A0E0JVF6_ORYPU
MTLCYPGTSTTTMRMEFMRRNDDKITDIDHTARAILYDPTAHSVRTLPSITTPKLWIILVTVDDDLYVMEMTSGR